MTQHYFNTVHRGDPITVLLGWEPKAISYFLVVERRAPAPDQDDYLYLSPYGPDAPRQDLAHCKSLLQAFGIEVPPSMYEQAALDSQRPTGRRIASYAPDGSFQLLL